MILVAAGFLLGPDLSGVLDLTLEDETVALAAELTLALLLFADASRIDANSLRHSLGLPARLLLVGMPLSIAIGAVATAFLLTDLRFAEAALIAAIVAPTDAALGEAVVSNKAVPLRIRQALNIESGLNDGLVVPVVALFAAMAAEQEVESAGSLVSEALAEIAVGVGVGIGVAVVTALTIGWIASRQWTDAEGFRLAALGCAVAAFAGSTALGGNGFVAAFVAGLVVGAMLGDVAHSHTELTEDLAQVGATITFVLFGALLVWPALDVVTPLIVVCALATLTVARIIPVLIATLGTGLKLPTVLFLGWFGPRGLASMVFGLLVVSQGVDEQVLSVIVIVIVASVFLHGMSASPAAVRYGAWFADHGTPELLAESVSVPERPMRRMAADDPT